MEDHLRYKTMSDTKARQYAEELDMLLRKSVAKGSTDVCVPNSIPQEYVHQYAEKHDKLVTLRVVGNQHDGESLQLSINLY